MTTEAELDSRPWYRHCWPWIVMAPPAAAVLAGIAMLSLAVVSDDGLVTPDASRGAMEGNARLTPEQAARCAVKDRRCMSATVEEAR